MRLPMLAGLVAALASPAAAQAATVQLRDDFDPRSGETSQEVIYTALPGELNGLDASFDGSRFYALSDPAGISPGRGCTRPNPADSTRARCEITKDFTSGMTIDLGDGDDSASVRGVGAVLTGGTGDDTLNGPDFGSRFVGGPGDDVMNGGASTDLFDEGASASGSDTISGGAGVDEVSYTRRTRNVRADLQGDRDDGEAGERDLIRDDVEDLSGGGGDDRLTGDGVANSIVGGRGTDVVKGGGGPDRLAAQSDLFAAGGQRTRDRIDGGGGDDTIGGSAGDNVLIGGRGRDAIFAGRGNDRIDARDDQIDTVECGSGRDRALLNGFDYFADRCEVVRRTFLPAATPIDLSSSGRRGGTAFVAVGCPRDAPRRCRGRVGIKRGSRTLGSRRFSIRRASVRDVAIELPASAVPGLRHGARVGVTIRSLDRLRRTRTIGTQLDLPAF